MHYFFKTWILCLQVPYKMKVSTELVFLDSLPACCCTFSTSRILQFCTFHVVPVCQNRRVSFTKCPKCFEPFFSNLFQVDLDSWQITEQRVNLSLSIALSSINTAQQRVCNCCDSLLAHSSYCIVYLVVQYKCSLWITFEFLNSFRSL